MIVKFFIEVVYQIELNNFTIKKIKDLKFKESNIIMIEHGLKELMEKHKLYLIYIQCTENFDRINQVLTSIASARKNSQRYSLAPNKKSSVILNAPMNETTDVNNFLLLKNILTQAYAKSKTFKLTIQPSSFRTLVASFMYLYDKIDKNGINPSPVDHHSKENSKALLIS